METPIAPPAQPECTAAPVTMRSVEITSGGRVEVVERQAPQGPLESGRVRIRMLAVGICGTDLSLAQGDRTPPRLPWRLGHEGIGEVMEVGPKVDDLHVGDRVALEPNVTCGTCRYCLAGATSACTERSSAGVLTQPGFLADVVDHPGEFCHRLGPTVPLPRAVCAEPLAVAASAVRRSGIQEGETALVLGAGAQGLLATMVLAAKGCEVHVSEPNAARRTLASELGARIFAPGQDPSATFEHVFDTSGVPDALASVIQHLPSRAVVTLVGETHQSLSISSFTIVQKQLRILGSFIYEHPQDMALAVALLERVPTETIMAPATALAQAAGVFARPPADSQTPTEAAAGQGIKQWVDMRS